MADGPSSWWSFVSTELRPEFRLVRVVVWGGLVAFATAGQFRVFPCNHMPTTSVVAMMLAVGVPAALLLGVLPLPATPRARIVAVVAVVAFTVVAVPFALLTHMCP